MTPHVNLSSFAGGGKTTIAKLLMAKYRTVMIPKITTRPRRPIEEIPEYIFVSQEEFEFRRSQGHFLSIEETITNGGAHYHVIPRIEHWPCVPDGTELVLSVFGSEARLAQAYAPEMKLIFISLRDRDLLAERLRRRCELDGSNFNRKWALNERYFSTEIEKKYDFIVYNDGAPEECVSQIITIIKER